MLYIFNLFVVVTCECRKDFWLSVVGIYIVDGCVGIIHRCKHEVNQVVLNMDMVSYINILISCWCGVWTTKHCISQRGLDWVGKVRSFRVPHLGLIPAAYRSPLVCILSEGWSPHTVLDWASSNWFRYWLSIRGCYITIKTPIFVSPKKKKKHCLFFFFSFFIFLFILYRYFNTLFVWRVNGFH